MFKNNLVAVVKVDGQILREKDGIVYLPFGSEYSIFMKNLEDRKAEIEVDIDGVNAVGRRGLISQPNSTFELKGFMTNAGLITNKFKFIQKTKEIMDYRGDRIDDGIVRIEFTFEKRVVTERVEQEVWINRKYWCPKDYDYPYPWYPRPFEPYYPYLYYWSSSNDTNSITYTSQNDSKSISNVNIGNLNIPVEDEGITVKGNPVNIQLGYDRIGELEEASSIITLVLRGTKEKLDGRIEKPLTVKTELKCSTCGRKWKSENKYCANCGTYLE